ncbi:MAG: ribosomal protein L35 [Planctomycetota bacterium]|jgi:ribosomal protein L35
MPKLKSKGSIKKRFKVTKSGMVVCKRAGGSHYNAHHSGSKRRSLRKKIHLNGTWSRLIRPMLGA